MIWCNTIHKHLQKLFQNTKPWPMNPYARLGRWTHVGDDKKCKTDEMTSREIRAPTWYRIKELAPLQAVIAKQAAHGVLTVSMWMLLLSDIQGTRIFIHLGFRISYVFGNVCLKNTQLGSRHIPQCPINRMSWESVCLEFRMSNRSSLYIPKDR